MAKIDFRTYLKLEKALANKLKAAWRPLLQESYSAIEKAVDSGDFSTAYRLAHELDCSTLGTENREYFKYNMLATINYGAAMASGDSDTITSYGNHEALLNRVADSFAQQMEYNVTIQTVKAAVQSIALAEKAYAEAHKAEGDTPRFVKPFVEFVEPSDSMIQLVSSLHSSRLATWGFTAEAEILGFDEYQLSAVLDGRTSDFCRLINGKVFKVSDARKSIVNILSLQNPDDAKTVAPWPSQTKDAIRDYSELSSEQMTALGFHIPPFHPFCRTILVRKKKAPILAKPIVQPDGQIIGPSPSTKETFAELGLTISDNGVKHWNDYVGLSPVKVLAQLSGLDPLSVINGALGKKFRSIVIAANGDINLSLKGLLGKAGKYSASAVIDPYTGTIFPDYLTFKNASPARAAEFFKTFYGGLLDVGESMGAKEIVMQAAGDTGAYLHTQAGFKASAGAWSDAAEAIAKSLAEGGVHADAYLTLQAEQQALLQKVLADVHEDALYVLANLPFELSGQPVGQLLMKGLNMEMGLDLNDATALAKAKKVLK